MPYKNIQTALTALTDPELRALQIAADGVPQITPGLCAFLSHACDWELARREGRNFAFNTPHAAISTEEIAVSLATIVALTESFDASPNVRAFLEAVGREIEQTPPALH